MSVGQHLTMLEHRQQHAAMAVALAATILLSCTAPSGPHFKHYRRDHPEWEAPDLVPSSGAELREVLAVADASPRRRSNGKTVRELRVFAVNETYWIELLAASFLNDDEPPEPDDYLVLAEVSCRRREPTLLYYSNQTYRWYFLRANQRVSYRHSIFESRCAGLDFTIGDPPDVPPATLSAEELRQWGLLGAPDAEA
jgi:hypothetical protein